MVAMTDGDVRDLYARLLEAWNGRDAEAFAALFADDGAMIGFDGSQATGREIREHLQPIFAGHPTAAYVAHVREVRPLAPGVALLRAAAGMVPPGADDLNPAVNTLQTLLAVRSGDGWRIVLFQNTPAQFHGRPELTEQHLAELRQVQRSGRTVA
jgi:uncharacterized protein (TIGR02246 family)